MCKPHVILLCIALSLASTAVAGPENEKTRTRVARLDGDPVYHWRAFTSILPDDVDRVLVLREFCRRSYNLPVKLIDEAIHEEIVQRHAGDEKRLVDSLKQKGTTLADFRQFVAEEITISAMLYQAPREHTHSAQVEWLAKLRKGAQIESPSAHK